MPYPFAIPATQPLASEQLQQRSQDAPPIAINQEMNENDLVLANREVKRRKVLKKALPAPPELAAVTSADVARSEQRKHVIQTCQTLNGMGGMEENAILLAINGLQQALQQQGHALQQQGHALQQQSHALQQQVHAMQLAMQHQTHALLALQQHAHETQVSLETIQSRLNNIEARQVNAGAREASDNLFPVHNQDGVVVPGFPNTLQDFFNLTASQMGDMLEHYGAARNPVATRAERLKRIIGIRF